jgi:hypothetical protein
MRKNIVFELLKGKSHIDDEGVDGSALSKSILKHVHRV